MFSIFVFLCVLSVLIFVHELGHFLAAKACGIFVDRFSIGMPPRVFGLRIGETDYCISALPIGGYVKMAGQEDAPMTEEERERDYGNIPPERWFNNKPIWQRWIVLAAGPLMNFALAILLYGGLAAMGRDVPEMEVSARIGEIEAEGPAADAPLYAVDAAAETADFSKTPDATGWQCGDTIVSVDGAPTAKYSDIFFAAVVGGEGAERTVVLERPRYDGGVQRYVSRIAPRVFGDVKHPRFGVMPYASCVAAHVLPDSPAQQAGIMEGDIIEWMDKTPVDQSTFVKRTEQTPEGATVQLRIDRDGQPVEVAAQPRTVGRTLGVVFGQDEAGGLPVVISADAAFTEKTKLQRLDVITSVNGQPATLDALSDAQLAQTSGVMTVEVERPAILFGLIQRAGRETLELPIEPVRAVGIALGHKTVHLTFPAHRWPAEAFRGAYNDLHQTLEILYGLITAKVSPEVIGGPVMIFDATAKMARAGFSWLVGIVALISVNLAVFNLLPLPILDGGQIVLSTLEAIRRKPLNPRFVERYQQAGLLLIIAFMLFVTSNDIMRWLSGLKP